MIEAKEIIVDICSKVLEHYAKKHEVENPDIRIRIDLAKTGQKPVFAIFNESTFIERCTLSDIIRAGGGKAFSMILAVQIRKIINDIFSQTLKQVKLSDPKQIFLLLYQGQNDDNVTYPTIALYKDGDYYSSMPIGEAMDIPEEIK